MLPEKSVAGQEATASTGHGTTDWFQIGKRESKGCIFPLSLCDFYAENCNHEIKRHFLLGRKAMINLDSILKNKDIILPTKVSIVKAMVFPVMYGCESRTIKKAEY